MEFKNIDYEIMLMNYVSKLLTSGQEKKATKLVREKEDIIEKLKNCLQDLEKIGTYEIGTIDIYNIGNYWSIDRISIFKDNKFLTNII